MIIKTVFGFVGNVRYEMRWPHDVLWKLLHGVAYACEFSTRYYAYEMRWWQDVVWKLLHGITRTSLLHGITRTR